jgi:hypothetical protein
MGERALLQRLLDRLQLRIGDLGAPAGRPAALESGGSCGLPAGMPAAGALPGDVQLTGDLGLGAPLGEQLSGAFRWAWRAARSWAARTRACCLRRLVDMPGMLPHHHPTVTLSLDPQPPPATKPRAGALDRPAVPAKPVRRLDPAPGDPRADATPTQIRPAAAIVSGLVAVDLGGPAPPAAGRHPGRGGMSSNTASTWSRRLC